MDAHRGNANSENARLNPFSEGKSVTGIGMDAVPGRSRQAVQRETVWSGIRTPSLDYCCLTKELGGWRFSGMLVARLQGGPLAARYEILVDETFKSRSLTIESMRVGKVTMRRVQFRGDKWLVDGKNRTDFRECTDVDIETSPVTNTIPIRRYRLKVGERVDLTVVWVRIPSLKVTPLKQSYERLGKREYRYRSASGFTAKVQVDDLGLVTRYGNIWKKVA
jgi:uncharacterized protein